MFGLPGHLKMPGLKLKHLLKKTMRGMLPQQTLKKPKGGFNAPVPRWLKNELRPLVHQYLSPARIRAQGLFNPETVSRLVSDHLAGRADYSRNIWALLVFTIWQEQSIRQRTEPIGHVPAVVSTVS